jgi:hypothetical protein
MLNRRQTLAGIAALTGIADTAQAKGPYSAPCWPGPS